MKYYNYLQQPEKDFLDYLTKELQISLQNDFRSDFASIKNALKDVFGPLRESMDTTNLGILLSQIKKSKEIYQYLLNIESDIIHSRDEYVKDIDAEFINW